MMGAILILSTGFVFAAGDPQTQDLGKAQQRVGTRVQTRVLFVDENGDGICDFARDHDNDGIPNCQDPDWERPQNGTGYMIKNGSNSGSSQLRNGNGNLGGNSWGRQDFGQNQGSFGNGICDSTGPKGKGNRGGRG
jgi:hypothetical protein